MSKIKKNQTKYIVMTAMFVALGYALSFLEIPMPAPITFLQLDFSNLPTMLCGFLLGPIAMIVCEAAKQLLWFATHSSNGGVGQIANFCMTVAYAIVPSVMYMFRKGRKSVIISMAIGCVLQTLAALLINRFITFPLYMGGGAASAFASLWVYLVAFNIAKAVIISVLTFFVYKSLSRAVKHLFGEQSEVQGNAENKD